MQVESVSEEETFLGCLQRSEIAERCGGGDDHIQHEEDSARP